VSLAGPEKARDTSDMHDLESLTNQFLIAMPALEDTNFSRTVTYICEHNAQGAMGIVVNRPISLQLGDMLDQLEIPVPSLAARGLPIYLGGPVQTDRGFVLHSGERTWDSTLHITPTVSVTTSKDILEAIAQGVGPAHALIALGYAGWTSGQLEGEMGANAWLSGPASEDVLFCTPADQRWRAAARLLGVDMDLLSGEVGHA
jgi:putative transcriptional regulator